MATFDLFKHIDIIAVLLVVIGGLFATKYFKWWGLNNAAKTLIFGTIFIGIYILVLHLSGELRKEDYSKYFISYAVATTFYELIKKVIIGNIKKQVDKPDTDYPG